MKVKQKMRLSALSWLAERVSKTEKNRRRRDSSFMREVKILDEFIIKNV